MQMGAVDFLKERLVMILVEPSSEHWRNSDNWQFIPLCVPEIYAPSHIPTRSLVTQNTRCFRDIGSWAISCLKLAKNKEISVTFIHHQVHIQMEMQYMAIRFNKNICCFFSSTTMTTDRLQMPNQSVWVLNIVRKGWKWNL